jgi:hypothetical protein
VASDPVEPTAEEPTPPPRSRRTLALVLVVLATLFAFLGIFAVWANRQALDTDNWTETSTGLLENRQIRNQVALFLVDQLYTNVDVAGVIREALPPRADPLAAPAASALRGLIEDRAKIFLGRPRVQKAWQDANRRAHERLLKVIDGGGEVLSTEEGTVTLDLKALLGATADNVGVGGRAEGKIPEGAAQITIMKSDQLALAQDVMRLIPKLALGLVLLSLGLFAAAIWLAGTWRRKALRASGIGLFVAGAAALLADSAAGDAVVNALATNEAVKPAVAATWTISTTLLDEAAWATLGYGVVVVFAAWLAGPSVVAVGTRRVLAPYLRSPAVAYGALAVIVVLVLAWGPTPATRKAVPAVVLIGLLALGMEMLRRQTAREFPGATLEGAMDRWRQRGSRLMDASRDQGTRWRTAAQESRAARAKSGSSSSAADARLAELERLTELRDAGALEPEEFQREKQRILDMAPDAPTSPA